MKHVVLMIAILTAVVAFAAETVKPKKPEEDFT